MASSGTLSKNGLFFDELNKIRVLDPDVYQQAIELREDSKEFVDQIGEFQKLVDGFLEIMNTLGNEVEKEKLKAIGSRNLLKSIAKEREAKQQQLQALIMEKKLQLERLKVQYESLRKQEADQNELIEQFLIQK